MTSEVTYSVRSFVRERKYDIMHTSFLLTLTMFLSCRKTANIGISCFFHGSGSQQGCSTLPPTSFSLVSIHFEDSRISTDRYLSYTGGDPIGIELSGALKNVYAIAAGMSDGLGFENNTRASEYIQTIACHISLKWPT